MTKELEGLNHSPITMKPNYVKIPITLFMTDVDDAHRFNEIYDWVRQSGLDKLKSTPSGGISISRENFKGEGWQLRKTKSLIELVIINIDGCFRVQFRNIPKDNYDQAFISGKTAFTVFKKTLKDWGYNIDDWAISNGKEVKKSIPSPKIWLDERFRDLTLEGCHHLDFNSSHDSGMAEFVPEWFEPLNYIYNKRKQDPTYKAILTHMWGYLQSECCDYKWAHISKAGIEYTNRNIDQMAEKLKKSGRQPICYNTDGIWYLGDVYHDEDEGGEFGNNHWKNDHINCTVRFKSKGAYEYIEDGKYVPVVRGVPRHITSEWTWGGIYGKNAKPQLIYWDDNNGLMMEGVKL